MIIFTMSVLGLPLPLLAIQILRINLVTDGLPALALGVDPVDKNIMQRSPKPPKE
jgi:Ca2+-transporting ATPase